METVLIPNTNNNVNVIEKTSITNVDSTELLSKLCKRGLRIDYKLRTNLINFEKYCRNNSDKDVDIIIKNCGINFNETTFNIIKIFKKNNKNINYIDYVLIFNALDTQIIKNLHRYLIVKWNRVLIKNNNTENGLEYIKNIGFISQTEISNLNNREEVFDKFVFSISNFIDKFNANIPINLYLLFVINNIQEYLYP
jgi:hypothetical protein